LRPKNPQVLKITIEFQCMEDSMQGFLNRPSVVFCGLLIMLNALAAGCGSKQYGEQVTTVNYYPQCYAPIQALRDADKDFNNTVIASTAIGAIGGAALGFLYGRGRARDVAVGAAIGGLAGAGFGYA
jgi:outer membrane lipoprotein SlyB